VIEVGDTASITCYSSFYTPPQWLYYGLSSNATPCGFDTSSSATQLSGVAVCPSAPRISAEYSSLQRNRTTLTISRTRLSDAGTYTCGSPDPDDRNATSSIIVGVVGTGRIYKRNPFYLPFE